MSTYPRELIFRERKDIDEFLSEPGLNSSLYELLLSVREPNNVRYALKVTPLQIFNEAYGQALRAIVDKHPEEDYYNNYFINARKNFERSYEAELVFCVVYVLLRFSNIDTPNVRRFLGVIKRNMEGREAYFPDFLKFCDEVTSDPFFSPETDRFYLHTDPVGINELNDIDWLSATYRYNEQTIQQYLLFAVDHDYQIAMLDSIYSDFEINQLLYDPGIPDIKPMIDRLKNACDRIPKRVVPLPVVSAEYSSEVLANTNDIEILKKEVEKLRQQNEELRIRREQEESEERTVKIKDLVAVAKSFEASEAKSVFHAIRLLVAEQDGNWIEKVKAEEIVLDQRVITSSKYRIANRRNTDFVKIISAMYDCRMFMTPEGLLASNKQEVMNEFGKLLQADLSSYSTLLSRAKDTDNFLEIFDQLKEAGEKYYNQ